MGFKLSNGIFDRGYWVSHPVEELKRENLKWRGADFGDDFAEVVNLSLFRESDTKLCLPVSDDAWDDMIWSFRDLFPSPDNLHEHVLDGLDDSGVFGYKGLIDFSQPNEHFSRTTEQFVNLSFGVTYKGVILGLQHHGEIYLSDDEGEPPCIYVSKVGLEEDWLPALN